MTDDPSRADAAVVYRSLRDVGAGSALEIASRCFPVSSEGPASTLIALRKRSVRRVLESVVWMRGQGVVISCIPSVDSASTFHLGLVRAVVTPKLSQRPVSLTSAPEDVSDLMDVWHGGGNRGI